MVYVASSWRNGQQPSVVKRLRDAGHDVYDFRDHGFHWSEIDPKWQTWTPPEYREHLLTHPLAIQAFAKDMAALRGADAVVLVQPCGRSAHLEFGWAIGAGKLGIILLAGDEEPELMNRMATAVCVTIEETIELLAIKSEPSDLLKTSRRAT